MRMQNYSLSGRCFLYFYMSIGRTVVRKVGVEDLSEYCRRKPGPAFPQETWPPRYSECGQMSTTKTVSPSTGSVFCLLHIQQNCSTKGAFRPTLPYSLFYSSFLNSHSGNPPFSCIVPGKKKKKGEQTEQARTRAFVSEAWLD